jgi:hypothetical protein
MNCEDFLDGVRDLERYGLDVVGPDVLEHADECKPCAARMLAEARLSAGLRAVAAESEAISAPPRIEARLLAAFRAAHEIGAQRRAAWWSLPFVPWAAAAVLAAGLAFTAWIAPKRHVTAPAARHTSPAQIELASLTNSQEGDDGFIQLPDAPQIDPNDDVNVVRMELPRSAMLAVGLEVNPDQVSDTVEAEVKLGSDGLARAVRFME